MVKCHFEDSINVHNETEIYEQMSTTSQDIMMKYSGCSEDIYESMLEINPECVEDLCKTGFYVIIIYKNITKLLCAELMCFFFPPDEVMAAVEENPEEVMLRKFFQRM